MDLALGSNLQCWCQTTPLSIFSFSGLGHIRYPLLEIWSKVKTFLNHTKSDCSTCYVDHQRFTVYFANTHFLMQIVYQDAIPNGKYNVCYTYLTKHGTLNSINLKFERQAVKFFRGQASSFTHLLIEQRRRRRRRKAWHGGGGCSEIVQSG